MSRSVAGRTPTIAVDDVIDPARDGGRRDEAPRPALARRPGPAWASVLLVHGIAEHSGRYEQVGDRFAAAGLDVQAYDQRGFGASGGTAGVRRPLGAAATRTSGERLRVVRADAAGRPVVAVRALAGRARSPWAMSLTDRAEAGPPGASAPGDRGERPRLEADDGPSPWPRRAQDARRERPSTGRPCPVTEASASATSADPLNEHSTTTRFGAEALAEQARVQANLARLALPTLVIHGADDGLVPPASSEPLGELTGVTRREYPGIRHELHNEPEGPAVIDDVIAWIRAQRSPRA